MSTKPLKKEKVYGTTKLFKGCNCKRTRCQKNFCECYKNSKLCSEFCKCIDCQNIGVRNATIVEVTKTESETQPEPLAEESYVIENEVPISCYTIAPKKNFNVITSDIIDSTVECLLAQAEECQSNDVTAKTAEQMIIEEFGRCLEQILRLSNLENLLD